MIMMISIETFSSICFESHPVLSGRNLISVVWKAKQRNILWATSFQTTVTAKDQWSLMATVASQPARLLEDCSIRRTVDGGGGGGVVGAFFNEHNLWNHLKHKCKQHKIYQFCHCRHRQRSLLLSRSTITTASRLLPTDIVTMADSLIRLQTPVVGLMFNAWHLWTS